MNKNKEIQHPSFTTGLITGLFIGSIVGIFAVALCSASKISPDDFVLYVHPVDNNGKFDKDKSYE